MENGNNNSPRRLSIMQEINLKRKTSAPDVNTMINTILGEDFKNEENQVRHNRSGSINFKVNPAATNIQFFQNMDNGEFHPLLKRNYSCIDFVKYPVSSFLYAKMRETKKIQFPMPNILTKKIIPNELIPINNKESLDMYNNLNKKVSFGNVKEIKNYLEQNDLHIIKNSIEYKNNEIDPSVQKINFPKYFKDRLSSVISINKVRTSISTIPENSVIINENKYNKYNDTLNEIANDTNKQLNSTYASFVEKSKPLHERNSNLNNNRNNDGMYNLYNDANFKIKDKDKDKAFRNRSVDISSLNTANYLNNANNISVNVANSLSNISNINNYKNNSSQLQLNKINKNSKAIRQSKMNFSKTNTSFVSDSLYRNNYDHTKYSKLDNVSMSKIEGKLEEIRNLNILYKNKDPNLNVDKNFYKFNRLDNIFNKLNLDKQQLKFKFENNVQSNHMIFFTRQEIAENDINKLKNLDNEKEIKLKLPRVSEANIKLNPEELIAFHKPIKAVKDNIIIKAMKRIERLKSFDYKCRLRGNI